MTGVHDRFIQIIEAYWLGNRSRMARDLGVSTSLVCKVSRRERSLGPALLNALAQDPRIDINWLQTGKGQPPPKELKRAIHAKKGLPLVEYPVTAEELATGSRVLATMCLLSAEHESRTRYLLRVRQNSPIIGDPTAKVEENDLLLVETCRELLGIPNLLGGHLIVVNTGSEKYPNLEIGRAKLADPEVPNRLSVSIPQGRDLIVNFPEESRSEKGERTRLIKLSNPIPSVDDDESKPVTRPTSVSSGAIKGFVEMVVRFC